MIFSYGIALVRYNPILARYEILLILRRTSYAFLDFVRGHYSKSNVRELFRNMTYLERIAVSTMDFRHMWFHAYLSQPPTNSRYGLDRSHESARYNKLHATFKSHWRSSTELRAMLSECRSDKNLWEIPKGRSNPRETPLITAMRETREETGISERSYRVLKMDPYTTTFRDRGKEYQYVFYMACPQSTFRIPALNYGDKSQIREVAGIQWFGLDDVRKMKDTRLKNMATAIIKIVKKRYPGAGDPRSALSLGDWTVRELNNPFLAHLA